MRLAAFRAASIVRMWVFESNELTGFITLVGLNAGPDFVKRPSVGRAVSLACGRPTMGISMRVGEPRLEVEQRARYIDSAQIYRKKMQRLSTCMH